jgi:tyrosinase
MHELALQKLCNYKGAHPYRDELTDYTNEDVSQSPVFDSITGFGGNGTGADSCVGDGPFKNIKLHMGNRHARGDEFCLSRGLDQISFAEGAAANIEECFGFQDYTDT